MLQSLGRLVLFTAFCVHGKHHLVLLKLNLKLKLSHIETNTRIETLCRPAYCFECGTFNAVSS
jgi:hypothetical protein